MQTVNFQCGHCNNLMAVGLEHLGQQLLCPHCQQVVVAPAGALPAPDPTPPSAPDPISRSEDIFAQPGPNDDPLFGPDSDPPPEQPAPPSPVETAPEPQPAAPEPEPPPAPLPWIDSGAPAGTEAPAEIAPVATIRQPRDYSGRVNWFIPLVFIPLVLYAVLSTAIAGYLYVKLQSQPASLFDQAPDWEGDTPGVRKEKAKASLEYGPKVATQPLPAHLRVRLGETIRVGDLEVTPEKVERRKVELVAEGAEGKPEPSPTDALVLRLRLRNAAEDYAFTPLDNFFDRRWKPGDDRSPPLTLLQAGQETFFGGSAKWLPLGRGRKERREWLVGRDNIDRKGLAPGEEQETFVATDGWDPAVARHLFGVDEEGNAVNKPYRGPLLWRVQLRRGLIDWKGRRLPATAVVGVEFTDRDYSGSAS
jgi:hypothetical protein